MRKIESFSPPRSSLASESPPVTPTPFTMPKPQHIKQCPKQNRRLGEQQKSINVGVQQEPAYLDLTNPKHHRASSRPIAPLSSTQSSLTSCVAVKPHHHQSHRSDWFANLPCRLHDFGSHSRYYGARNIRI